MFDIYSLELYFSMIALLGVGSFLLLLIYIFRWRYDKLAAKYAAWQKEAQDVEVATHSALYDQLHEEKPVYPKISIIVPCCNQSRELAYLLPRLLEQVYAGKFEVVVADQISQDDTDILLERLCIDFPHLRKTFVPASSRHIELRKLAITLGVKSARSEWCIIVNPETVPVTKHWLQHYAENLLPDVDFVEAYFNYEDDGTAVARRAILERVRRFNEWLVAYEGGDVVGCETANFAVRKQWFLEQQGFADSLSLPFGEESIYAYLHANAERTTLLCSPDTKLQEVLPSARELCEKRVWEAETQRKLPNYMWRFGWRYRIVAFLVPLLGLTNTVYLVLRLWQDIAAETYSLNYLYSDLVWLLICALSAWFPIVNLRCSLRALDERNFGAYIYVFDWLQPWRNLHVSVLRRLRSSDFVRKYVTHIPQEKAKE